MKKKKSPAGLIVAIIAIAGFLAFQNLASTGVFDELAQKSMAAKRSEAGSKEELAGKSTKDAMKASLSSTTSGKSPTPEVMPEDQAAKTKPVVAVDKPQKYKPTPNPTSTSAHWYTPESER